MIDGAGAVERGNDRVPEPADDVDVSWRSPRQADRLTNDAGDEPAEPQLVKDESRAGIAARFKNRRADNRAGVVPRSHVPAIDGDLDDPDHPDYIASDEGRPTSVEPEDRQRRVESNDEGRGQSPVVGGQTPYKLTVFGNQIIARDRAELARFAEVDEDEANDYSDAALIRLAQKQVAANQRLDLAKETEKRARMTGGAFAGTPPDDDPSDQPESSATTTAGRKPAPETVELVREMIYGDPEEAARRIEDMMDRGVDQRMERRDTARTVDQINRELVTTLDSIGRENADLASIPEASDLVAVKTTRLIVEELRKCGITDSEATQLSINPQLAAQAYVGAQALPQFQGKLKRIDQIAQEAVTTARRTFGMTKPVAPQQQSSVPANPPPTRRDLKRTLPQQPARAGTPLPTDLPMERDDARKSRASRAIDQMRRSRHQ